ncbi:MAG: beta-lactamase family protein [Anaerolineae bacterium]|nr:beta-lactamase family protein [Anaerolineae bacterium]
MKAKIVILTLCVVFLGIITALPVQADVDGTSAGFGEIDAYIQEQMQRSGIRGLSYAIIQGQEVVQSHAFGKAGPQGRPMTTETPIIIGSVGKTMTALAVRQLVNEGLLELQMPVQAILPEFQLADPNASSLITIRHLLEHTSGIGNLAGNDPAYYDPEKSSAELVAMMRAVNINRPVGSCYEYSNLNYIILGEIIARISGMAYPDYVQTHIYDPLDMKNSYVSQEQALLSGMSSGYRYYFGIPVDVTVPYPAAQLSAGFHISTAEDMTHYLIAIANHGQYGERSIIYRDGREPTSAAAVNYTVEWMDFAEGGKSGNTERYNGAWLNYSAGMVYMPFDHIGVVVLANSNPSQWLPVKSAGDIAFDVLRLYTGNPPDPSKPALILLYIIADTLLLAGAAAVAWRWRLLFSGAGHAARFRGVVLLDLVLPVLVLLVFPIFQLGSPGNWVLDPVWCWNRYIFSVPDIGWALIALAGALLLCGVVKVFIRISESD